MSENLRIILMFAGIIVVVAAYVLIKKRMNLTKAANGEDQKKLEEAVAQVLPGESGYKVVYAHWERSETYGRRTTTYYYSYALAFDAERLWVVPLKFEGGIVDPGRPVCLSSQSLGMVEADDKMSKDRLWRVALTLRDKDGKDFLNCWVDAENTKEDRFHHFNLLQQENCEQFSRFLQALAAKVAQENPDMDQHIASALEEERAKRAKRARLLGIVGVVCFFIPIISIVFGVVGLLAAPKPKETGGKATSSFIMPLLSLILGVLVCVGFVAIASL